MNRSPFGLTLAALGSSFALHGAAYASLPPAPSFVPSEGPSQVIVEIPPPSSQPRRTVEQPPPEPEPEPARPVPVSRPASVSPAPVPERAPAPIDLRGVTLTNDGPEGFGSVLGDGTSLDGPIRAPIAAAVPVPPAAAPSAAPALQGPRVVRAADLSARPEPPVLDAALRNNYPAAAEVQGVGGSASVRARIEPDGRVLRVGVLSESFPGFGQACRRTLLGSRWSAPRDREGRAVATEIRYTCRFVVSR